MRPRFDIHLFDSREIVGILRLEKHVMIILQVAEEVRTHVHAATGLTCSCGTAPNSMLAKICSDMRCDLPFLRLGNGRFSEFDVANYQI